MRFGAFIFIAPYSNGPLNESPNRFLFSMNVINFYDWIEQYTEEKTLSIHLLDLTIVASLSNVGV